MRFAKRLLSLSTLLGLLAGGTWGAEEARPPRIAVLSVRAEGEVRAYRAAEVTARLRLHLPGLIHCESISGDELARVLRERRLSDEAQTPAGYVEIGRALAVDYVIVGSLAQRPDNRYRIHLSLLGVEEGRELCTAQREVVAANFADLLGEPLRSLAGILLAGMPAPSLRPSAVAERPAAATAAPAWATPVALLSPEEEAERLAAVRRRLAAKMVEVPAGRFVMGSDTGEPDERPRQYVFVDRFYIDLYEVSNRDYAEFLAFTGRTAPPHWKNAAYPEGADDYPVNNVSYADAEAFAAWAGKRLPTEREWEKAARGQDGRIYSWGDVFDASSCNTWESRRGEPAPVDAFPDARSPFGLYNCVGNVWEWVDAWYDAYPESTYRRAEFGQTYRVLRGGGWNMDAYYARCSARYFLEPRFRHPSFGFRCAMSPAQYEAVK